MDDKIDFVITWVDGGDIEWQKERNKFAGKDPEDIANYRFRDWDTLKYWFRGVEKFAPWVNNVFFVTNGQKPEWLNLNHPKLKWIKHVDYIPKEYLPTFNSHTIEHNFFRIKGLSEQFVYFNDDFFLTDYVKKTDFFYNSKPKTIAQLKPCINKDEMYSHILLNDLLLINRHFDFREFFRKNKFKLISYKYRWKDNLKTYFLSKNSLFPGFAVPHIENSILKSTMASLWEIEYDILNKTCLKKFRDDTQVSQNIYMWYQIASGNFKERSQNFGQFFTVNDANLIKNKMTKHKYKSICINDSILNGDFETTKSIVHSAFDQILPDKSTFEL